MIQQMYTIKEAAKELGVEAHALRYWEEELNLTIGRNAQGRRVYTEENMQTFKDIMAWKGQGLQLKSIKEMIHGKETDQELSGSRDELAGHRIIVYRPKETTALEAPEQPTPGRAMVEYDASSVEKAEKARRLQELLKQFISESIRERQMITPVRRLWQVADIETLHLIVQLTILQAMITILQDILPQMESFLTGCLIISMSSRIKVL